MSSAVEPVSGTSNSPGPEVTPAESSLGVFGDDLPPELVAETAHFEAWENTDAAEARGRLIELGPAVADDVLAALEDVIDALAPYDPRSLSDAERARYIALMAMSNHLVAVIGAVGEERHVDRLIALGKRMNPHNLVSAALYQAVDSIAPDGHSERLAASIIANPNADSMQLLAAMSRYWLATPGEVGADALVHTRDEFLLTRAMAYKLAINAGLGEQVRVALIADVDSIEYAKSGNKQALLALAGIEPPATFRPRVETLRLRPAVRDAALLYNRFAWSDAEARELLIEPLVDSREQELVAEAVRFMLENDRSDLLQQHRLAMPQPDPFDILSHVVPGFDTMSREQRLEYLDEDELAELERQQAASSGVAMSETTRLVVDRLGYELTANGQRLLISRR